MKFETVQQIINTCDVRYTFSRACDGCPYKGVKCNKAIHILKVSKPYEYLDNKEIKVLKKKGFDSNEEINRN